MSTPNENSTFTLITEVSDRDLLNYLLKEGTKTRDELDEEIKERFWSREDFMAYLNIP